MTPGGYQVTAGFVEASFRKHRTMPAAARLRRVAQDIEHRIWLTHGYEMTGGERAALRASLKKMYKGTTLRAAYKNFFDWLGKPELFKPAKGGVLEYADVFPLIHLKIKLEGPGETRRRAISSSQEMHRP